MKAVPQNTESFEYYNANPRSRKSNDCVVRAISTATGIPWDDVFKGLCELSLKRKLMPNDKRVFDEYIKSLGWCRQLTYRSLEGKGLNIHEVVYRKGLVGPIIFGTRGHLSCYKNGKVYDTWDCGKNTAGIYYTLPDIN